MSDDIEKRLKELEITVEWLTDWLFSMMSAISTDGPSKMKEDLKKRQEQATEMPEHET